VPGVGGSLVDLGPTNHSAICPAAEFSGAG
jgi:hypothetical protein